MSKRPAQKVIAGLGLLLLFALCATGAGYVGVQIREQKTIDDLGNGRGIFVQTHDARIFLQDLGPRSGPAVVMFHGMGARSELFRPVINALVGAGFRVLAFDIPPFGFSEKLTGAENYQTAKQASRVHEVLNQLKIDRALLFCHSIGCRLGMETLLENPAIFRSAVLAAPVLGFADDREHIHFQQNDPGLALKMLLSPTPVRDGLSGIYGTNPMSVRSLLKLFVYDDACVTDERVKMLAEPLVLKGMTEASGDWVENLMTAHERGRFIQFQDYSRLNIPVLIVWGDRDDVTPLWQGEALQRTFPDASMSIIPGSGHMVYLERTKEFNALVVRFLQAHH